MEISHDVRQRKFYSMVKEMEYSVEYNEIDPKTWEFHCPLPPTTEKAKEIQDKIVEYALFYVKRNNIRLMEICNCPYISDFLRRRKELAEQIETINC